MAGLKLVVVGDSSVGKTCLLISYTVGVFPKEYVPETLDNYSIRVWVDVDEEPAKLVWWDTTGQEYFDSLRPLSYPGTDVFFICFDINNKESFQNVTMKWIPEIKYHSPDVPKIIVGCKMDLRSSVPDKCLPRSVAEEKAKKLGISDYETSTLTKEGLTACFDKATEFAYRMFMSKDVVVEESDEDGEEWGDDDDDEDDDDQECKEDDGNNSNQDQVTTSSENHVINESHDSVPTESHNPDPTKSEDHKPT